MGTNYDHLTLEERCRLRGLMEMGLSRAEIARRLGRRRSTIYRELGRNRNAAGYRPDGGIGKGQQDANTGAGIATTVVTHGVSQYHGIGGPGANEMCFGGKVPVHLFIRNTSGEQRRNLYFARNMWSTGTSEWRNVRP